MLHLPKTKQQQISKFQIKTNTVIDIFLNLEPVETTLKMRLGIFHHSVVYLSLNPKHTTLFPSKQVGRVLFFILDKFMCVIFCFILIIKQLIRCGCYIRRICILTKKDKLFNNYLLSHQKTTICLLHTV